MASSYFYIGSERGNLWKAAKGGSGPKLYTVEDPGRTWGTKTLAEWKAEGLNENQLTEVSAPMTGKQLGAALALGMGLGADLGSAIGKGIIASGSAAALRSQAAVTEDNAQIAQMGVEQAFRFGEAQIAQIGRQQAEVKARQRVAFAANGLSIGVGSTAEIAATTDINAETDKQTARLNALMKAWGYRRQRRMAFAQAEGQRIMAKATRTAGYVTMGADLMNTAFNAWAGATGGLSGD